MVTAVGAKTVASIPARRARTEPIELSILIVNYNTRDLLRQCLHSVYAHDHGLTFEVILVDNGSLDRSVEMVGREFPEVRLVENDDNRGFSVANNEAIQASCGRYVLLLNSDTIVVPGTLQRMVTYLKANPEVGIAGCRLIRPNGELDYACRRSFPTPLVSLTRFLRLNRLFPRSKLCGRYNLTYLDEKDTYEVDSIVGACMLLRREVVDEVGGLDEDYFMYGEDVDWCYRIKGASWKVAYLGGAHIVHYKGASSRKESFRMNYHFHRAMYLFHRKHLSRQYPLLLNAAVYSGIFCRFSLLAVNHLIRTCLRRIVPVAWPRSKPVYNCDLLVKSSLPESSLKS